MDPNAVSAEPVPLMLIDVQSPQENSDVEFSETTDVPPHEEPVSSQVSLFSVSEGSICEFSEEGSACFSPPSLSPSPFPSISSFTSLSGNCSESILNGISIVSSNPKFFILADFLILGSDFNCYESDLDKFGGNISTASYLSDFQPSFKLVDIWHKNYCKHREMS